MRTRGNAARPGFALCTLSDAVPAFHLDLTLFSGDAVAVFTVVGSRPVHLVGMITTPAGDSHGGAEEDEEEEEDVVEDLEEEDLAPLPATASKELRDARAEREHTIQRFNTAAYKEELGVMSALQARLKVGGSSTADFLSATIEGLPPATRCTLVAMMLKTLMRHNIEVVGDDAVPVTMGY